jgi:beta-N-acetylhexosaminidase
MRRRTLLQVAAASAVAACMPNAPGGDPTVDLSLERKVGQLMSVAFHGKAITGALEAMIRKRGVGGVVLYAENFADASALAKLINDLSRIAREANVPPLFFEIDHEGGAVQRIAKGATILPGQMALAATPDPERSVRVAAGVAAAELRAFGVNWNFAPDADVNDEPANPIIGNRSFSSDSARVATLVTTAVRTYADAGFLCCVKHFPGHGSTTVDSHSGLPKIEADRATIERIHVPPFRAAIAAGVPAVMTAHIVVPALDPTPDLPVTLSAPVLEGLLRGQLGFDGVIITDDLEMGALARIGQPEAALRALQAGADFLLFRFDESAQVEGHRRIVDAVRTGALPSARVDASVRRVLDLKRRFGVLEGRRETASPDFAANTRAALDLARDGVTLLRNRGVLPLRGSAVVAAPANADPSVLEGQPSLGTVIARKRPDATVLNLPLRPSGADIERVVAAARTADVAVVGTTDLFTYSEQVQLLRAVMREKPVVMVSLRGPYDLLTVGDVPACLCTYGAREPSLVAASEVLFGERKPVGALPVDVPGLFRIGAGMRDFRE